MGRQTFKIVVSLLAAGATALCAFFLLQAALLNGHRLAAGPMLFRFQIGTMVSLALFAGLAIVIYARLSR
jgi:hypothetical protein